MRKAKDIPGFGSTRIHDWDRKRIKVNELRVGNWVNMPGPKMARGFYHAEKITNWAKQSVDQWEPIPLTTEWLEAFGFEFHTNGLQKSWTFEMLKLWEILTPEHNFLSSHCVSPPIKTVHQLQNYYYAMTGKELVLNMHQ